MNEENDRKRGSGPVRWFLASIGSLKLAVVLLTVYAVVVGWATLIDNRYGATAVAWGIYRSGWFTALNSLLGLNVLTSAIMRFPWRRRHLGFLMTHAGILLLLVGAAVTWQGGVDGVTGIFEGKSSSRIITDQRELVVTINGDGTDAISEQIPIDPGPFSWSMLRDTGTDDALGTLPWRLSDRGQPRTVCHDGQIRVELLDWLAQVTLEPVGDTDSPDKTTRENESDNPGVMPQWAMPSRSPVPISVTIRPVPFPGESTTRADREAWMDRGLRAAKFRVRYGSEIENFQDIWLLLDESESAKFRRMAGDSLTSENFADAEVVERVRYTSPLTPEMTTRTLSFGDRTVTISLRSRDADVGFGVRLHRFDRRFTPGSSQASYYASRIDLLEPDGSMAAVDQQISMNEPLEFRGTRLFQTSWRGPWAPGHPFFDAIEPIDSDADALYMTVLSASRDPGAGWKYAGSLLLLVGMTMVFVRKLKR